MQCAAQLMLLSASAAANVGADTVKVPRKERAFYTKNGMRHALSKALLT